LFLALFEDGDVPGECMFSFQSKQNKTPTSTKKYRTSQPNKNLQYHNKDDREIYNIRSESKLSHKY